MDDHWLPNEPLNETRLERNLDDVESHCREMEKTTRAVLKTLYALHPENISPVNVEEFQHCAEAWHRYTIAITDSYRIEVQKLRDLRIQLLNEANPTPPAIVPEQLNLMMMQVIFLSLFSGFVLGMFAAGLIYLIGKQMS